MAGGWFYYASGLQRPYAPSCSFVNAAVLVALHRARPINRPAGSLGRSQAGNLALRLWGDRRIPDAVLREWLDRLIARNGWLDMGRKRPIPHESFAQVAGYFFYFGHHYGARCIGELPAADRPFYQDHFARLLLAIQEPEGSWYDYLLYSYHKAYGTAFALLSLQCCRKGR